MEEKATKKHICVFKTGKLFEHDMASNAFNENGIPFYKQLETSSGLRLAMPFQPAMGPGTYYNIFVPAELVDDAKNILSNLPIEINDDPDIWHFGANEKAKKAWKLFVWIILIIGVLISSLNIIY